MLEIRPISNCFYLNIHLPSFQVGMGCSVQVAWIHWHFSKQATKIFGDWHVQEWPPKSPRIIIEEKCCASNKDSRRKCLFRLLMIILGDSWRFVLFRFTACKLSNKLILTTYVQVIFLYICLHHLSNLTFHKTIRDQDNYKYNIPREIEQYFLLYQIK